MDNNAASTQMPRYRCHKQVWALKIKAIDLRAAGPHYLEVEEAGFMPVEISDEWRLKHSPEAGGYYVVYDDGYRSFSPATAFEEGYTRIST